MELSDELFAARRAQGPRRGRWVKGGTPSEDVFYLHLPYDGDRITVCLNTSDEAKAIERARGIVEKAIVDGHTPPDSEAALAYASSRSAEPQCVWLDKVSGKYQTKFLRQDGTYDGNMSLGTGEAGLAKDRLRVVVPDWLDRGLISPSSKPARVYGPGGLDAQFSSETSHLEAERWYDGKRRRQRVKATMYTADEVETAGPRKPGVDAAEVDAVAERLAARSLANYENYKRDLATAARNLGLDRGVLDLLVKEKRNKRSSSSSSAPSRELVDGVGTRSVNRRAASRARSRARKSGREIPITGSAWQSKGGSETLWRELTPGRYTALLEIASRKYRWGPVSMSRKEAEASDAAVYQARGCVCEAFDQWRSFERTEKADEDLFKAQEGYLNELVEAGAESCKDWGELAKMLRELPSSAPVASLGSDSAKNRARSKFVNLLRKHPNGRPAGRTVRSVVEEVGSSEGLSRDKAWPEFEAAQAETGNDTWSKSGRPRNRPKSSGPAAAATDRNV
jgi:hypothetical protein